MFRLEYPWQLTTMLMMMYLGNCATLLPHFDDACLLSPIVQLVDSTMMVLPSTMAEHRCQLFDGVNMLSSRYIARYTNIHAN